MSDEPQVEVKNKRGVDEGTWLSWILELFAEGFFQLIWAMIRWIGVAIFHFFRFLIELIKHT